MYETNKTVAWTGGAWKRDTGPETIIMQNDGNFVMYDKNGPETIIMQNDGNFVMYDKNGNAQ